jgi:hypothetical protein
MSLLRKHRPSPAMIVALVALFVAMGGTGYAVTNLPKRSVGPAQLRKNAVRAEHIKAGSISAAKLAKSTLNSLRSPVAAPSLASGAAAAGAASGSTSADGRVAYADKAGFADRAALADRATTADRAATAGTAAAADSAAVADSAKLAENASRLGGKPVAEFVTSDTVHWVTPFTIGKGSREMLKAGPFTLTARCRLNETIGLVPNQDQADIVISTTQQDSAFDGEDLLGRFGPTTDIESRQFVNTAVSNHGLAKFEASSDGLAIGGDGVVYIKGSYLFAGINISGQPDKCKFGGYVFL